MDDDPGGLTAIDSAIDEEMLFHSRHNLRFHADLRAVLLEGRAAVLDARLDIHSVNIGDARRLLLLSRPAFGRDFTVVIVLSAHP